MHPELHRQVAVMKTSRPSGLYLCQSSVPFSSWGPLPDLRRDLGYDVVTFSLVVPIRLKRVAP
jgi:hypothetical protein